MTDALQHALHAAAAQSAPLGALAVFAANDLPFVLLAALAALAWFNRTKLTWQLAGRVVVSGILSLLLAKVLGHLVADPRPYLAEHYPPLAHVSADNGFPSDHTLMAALFTGWAAWFSRRWWPVFALGTLVILLGRLGIGAHHTLDVLGSLLIAAASLGITAVLPWPQGWRERPLLGVLSR